MWKPGGRKCSRKRRAANKTITATERDIRSMEKREYSAGAVKHSFWFMEFRKVVTLRNEGKTLEELQTMNEAENLFGAPTRLRSSQIWSTVCGRMKCLDDSFIPVFLRCDVASQKLLALVAAMAYDSLFGEFVYEVLREKMIVGSNEFSDGDIRIFFNHKQVQNEKVAQWTDETLARLGRCYKTMLYEAGVIEKTRNVRKILRPIPDLLLEQWLMEHQMEYYLKALTGVR